MHIAICDDQKSNAETVRTQVAEWSGRRKIEASVEMMSSGEELLKRIQADILSEERFDLILLDMKMAEMDGIETARRIRAIEPCAYIIFITNHFVEVIFDAFEVRAFRYIMKNRLAELLPKALDAVCEDMNHDRNNSLIVSFNRAQMRISLSEVIFFEGSARFVNVNLVHARAQRFSMKMDELEQAVRDKGFIRCHQSFIVNSKYIRKIRNYIVYTSDGREIPVSRTRYEQVKKEFAWSLR